MAPLLKKLFRLRRSATEDIPTVPLSKPTAEEDVTPDSRPQLEVQQFVVGCSQSAGVQRDHNEDALLTLTTNLASDHTRIPIGLYIVADGMGGHKHGEIASGLAVRAVGSYIIRKVLISLLSPKPIAPDDSIQEIMQEGVQEAHRVITKHAPGGGTTMTAILILDDQMTIAHVGDSRAYAISPQGEMNVLTRDHSLVMRMMELGQLSADEAAVHPQRNVLYRALGQGEPFSPDTNTLPLPKSGYLLLCSDGLWGVISEDEIAHIVTTAPNPQIATQKLIDAANEAGGPDNITAIIIQVPA
ncbi:MAG: PP2C family serine/threonine-protein phosphatase [Chloroflexota bacterium]